MASSMWTLAFWQTAGENAIRAAATSALGWVPVSTSINGWDDIPWDRGGLIIVLSAAASVLFSISTHGVTKNGPMFTASPKGEAKDDNPRN